MSHVAHERYASYRGSSMLLAIVSTSICAITSRLLRPRSCLDQAHTHLQCRLSPLCATLNARFLAHRHKHDDNDNDETCWCTCSPSLVSLLIAAVPNSVTFAPCDVRPTFHLLFQSCPEPCMENKAQPHLEMVRCIKHHAREFQ